MQIVPDLGFCAFSIARPQNHVQIGLDLGLWLFFDLGDDMPTSRARLVDGEESVVARLYILLQGLRCDLLA